MQITLVFRPGRIFFFTSLSMARLSLSTAVLQGCACLSEALDLFSVSVWQIYGTNWIHAHLCSTFRLPLDVLIEPLDMLKERRLFCELHPLIAHIRPHSKAMTNITVQTDLIWGLHLLQYVFCLSSLRRSEYVICFRGCDAQWRSHGPDLVRVYKRRMRHAGDINPLALCREAGNVLGAVAVADASEFLDA